MLQYPWTSDHGMKLTARLCVCSVVGDSVQSGSWVPLWKHMMLPSILPRVLKLHAATKKWVKIAFQMGPHDTLPLTPQQVRVFSTLQPTATTE